MATSKLLLGFDFGSLRIGVAVGDELIGSARPLVTLKSIDGGPDWNKIAQLLKEWQPEALVVGVPQHMDGTEHEMTRLATRFGNRLRGRYNLPVFFMDERLSSIEAEEQLGTSIDFKSRHHRSSARAAIDKVAASIILQRWFDRLKE